MAFKIQCSCGKMWSSETPPTEMSMQCPTCMQAARQQQLAVAAATRAEERKAQGERAIKTLEAMRQEYDDSEDEVFGRYEDAITLGCIVTLLESYEASNKAPDGGQAD